MFGCKSKAVTVIIKNAVTVFITPAIFVNLSIAVVVVTDVVVGEGNDFHLENDDLVRHPFTSVVVSNNHDIVAVFVVAVVTDKRIVIATLNVSGDFQPRRGVAVIPALIGVCCDFFTASIGSTVHAFVIFENIRVILSEAHHSSLHCLVCVVFLELKDVVSSWSPWEYHVDVIARPNVLRGIASGLILSSTGNGEWRNERQQKRENNESSKRGAGSNNSTVYHHGISQPKTLDFLKRSRQCLSP